MKIIMYSFNDFFHKHDFPYIRDWIVDKFYQKYHSCPFSLYIVMSFDNDWIWSIDQLPPIDLTDLKGVYTVNYSNERYTKKQNNPDLYNRLKIIFVDSRENELISILESFIDLYNLRHSC